MVRLRLLITALILAGSSLISAVQTVHANTGQVEQATVCSGGGTCSNEFPATDADADSWSIKQTNECADQHTICSNKIVLTGSFNTITITHTNSCKDHASCSNIVEIHGSVKHLVVKGLDHCSTGATCTSIPRTPLGHHR
jgi:hypothetical protein